LSIRKWKRKIEEDGRRKKDKEDRRKWKWIEDNNIHIIPS